jgi:hypothetical protein
MLVGAAALGICIDIYSHLECWQVLFISCQRNHGVKIIHPSKKAHIDYKQQIREIRDLVY